MSDHKMSSGKEISNVKIGILIPTRGDRPEFIAQCHRLIEAQTLQPTEILVVDYNPKGNAPDLVDRYQYGFEKLFGNKMDIVICWEDDDWYHHKYIEAIVTAWIDYNKPDLIGFKDTIYYNISNQKYTTINTKKMASMMCSAVTKSVLELKYPKSSEIHLDQIMWHQMNGVLLTARLVLCVGIKHGQGLCAGRGHQEDWSCYDQQDQDFKYLQSLIGPVDFYRKLVTVSKYKFSLGQFRSDPFMTIITRVFKDKRPKAYSIHNASIGDQTEFDFELLSIIDEVGYGVHEANKSLAEAVGKINGKYVYLLDDDNFLTNRNFIKDIKEVAKKHDPDVIFFRAIIKNGKYNNEYPTSHMWGGDTILPCHVGGICFVVKKEVFNTFIHNYNHPRMGDFHFIDAVVKSGASVYWLDEFQAETYRVGRGKVE